MNESASSTPTLWHCHNARSLRPLWTLEELDLPYKVECLPFPPRYRQREFLEINPLGTVPYFVDGQVRMTESTAICHYLAEKHGSDLRLTPEHPDYAAFLNFLYQSDATLTFPQTLVLRYRKLEAPERRQPQVADDYEKWFLGRLEWMDQHLQSGREYLCSDRFTIADIAVGYALYLGQLVGLAAGYTPRLADYLDRLKQRPAFERAAAVGA